METKPFITLDFKVKNDQICNGTGTFNVRKARVIGELERPVFNGEEIVMMLLTVWEDDMGNTYGTDELTVTELTDLLNGCCASDIVLPMETFTGEDTTTYPVGVWSVTGSFLGVANSQQEVLDLWNADPDNQARGTLVAGETSILFVLHTANSPGSIRALPYVEYPLTNFSDDPVPSTPYGLFATDETFLGLAGSGAAAASIWNANAPFNTEIIAEPIAGNDLALALFLNNPAAVVPDMKALRYWFITANNGTSVVYLSPGTIVRRANGTQINSEDGVLGAVGATSFGTSTVSLGHPANDLVDPLSPFYKITMSAGQNFFFHNEDGEWAWMDVFANVVSNGGNLPPTIRFLAMQANLVNNTTGSLSPMNFTNHLTALANVETIEFNGQVINPANTNTGVHLMPNLKVFFYIEVGSPGSTYNLSTFDLLSKTLDFVCIRRNNNVSRIFALDVAASFAPLTKGADFQGAMLPNSAATDQLLMDLELSITNTPAAGATINTTQNPLRTSASDSAHANIEAFGYNILP